MRKLLAFIAIAALAGIVSAEPRYIAYEGKIDTLSTSVVSVVKNPIGYVDEILFQAPTKGGVTSVVTIVSAPNVGSGMVSTVLYTNAAMTAAAVIRPRITQQDNTGTDLTSLSISERFLCNGDPVTLRVVQTSVVTGVVFKCWIKMDQ